MINWNVLTQQTLIKKQYPNIHGEIQAWLFNTLRLQQIDWYFVYNFKYIVFNRKFSILIEIPLNFGP